MFNVSKPIPKVKHHFVTEFPKRLSTTNAWFEFAGAYKSMYSAKHDVFYKTMKSNDIGMKLSQNLHFHYKNWLQLKNW